MNRKVWLYTKRVIVFLISLFIMALGVSFSVRADLGTTPTSCIPYVTSLYFPLSMGTLTIIMHIAFILIQILLLRKKFRPVNFLQLPLAFIFGYFTDFTLSLTSGLKAETYLMKLVFLAASILLVALGVYLLVSARIMVLAGEGLMMAFSKVTGAEFGKVKMIGDLSLVTIAALFSLITMHNVYGIREGTVASALLVGLLVRVFTRYFVFVDRFLEIRAYERSGETAAAAEIFAEQGIIITIAREFGSSGGLIAEKLAEKLGFELIMQKQLEAEAAENGIFDDYVSKHAGAPGSLFYDVYGRNFTYVFGENSAHEQLFGAQSDVINGIADRGNCILVGRLSNFILSDRRNALHVFIGADFKDRVKTVSSREHITKNHAAIAISRRDSERRSHCRTCTGREWTDPDNYSMTLNSSKIGIDGGVEMICAAVEQLKKQIASSESSS